MHIALFLSGLGGGGAQRRLFALGAAFARRGHRVDLVTASREGAFRARVPEALNLVAAEGPLSRLPLLGRLRGLYVPAAAGRLAGYLREARPDVLLSSSNPANAAAVRARRLSGLRIPLVLSVNVDLQGALAGRRGLEARLLAALVRRSYPEAEAVVAISRGVADSLRAVAGVADARLVTIANPVDLDALRRQAAQPLAHPWLAPGAPPLVLGVGKLKAQKDFETLIRAFAVLRRRRPATLAILGEGERRAALLALARRLGVAESVALPGFVQNPHAWMARAGLFVLSSRWEGFSNALAEALAVGCPVVATDCRSGPAELLQDGRLAPLVPVGDWAALAEAMQGVLASPPTAARLTARAAEFSVEAAAERYLAVLRAVVAGRPPAPLALPEAV